MRGPRSRSKRVSDLFRANIAPKVQHFFLYAFSAKDRDVAQVCRDRDDLTVPTVSEVHTLADAHEAARVGRPTILSGRRAARASCLRNCASNAIS